MHTWTQSPCHSIFDRHFYGFEVVSCLLPAACCLLPMAPKWGPTGRSPDLLLSAQVSLHHPNPQAPGLGSSSQAAPSSSSASVPPVASTPVPSLPLLTRWARHLHLAQTQPGPCLDPPNQLCIVEVGAMSGSPPVERALVQDIWVLCVRTSS